MLALAILLAAVPAPPAAEQCRAEDGCITTAAPQLFAFADELFRARDFAGAVEVLQSLTLDRDPRLRAEARFRLAAVLEAMDDLPRAAKALRALLAEQPGAQRARLELARILSRLGQTSAARSELRQVDADGLPPEVRQTVRQFSTSLAPPRRRGLSLEFASGPDSNINRATASRFIDTIIAPFELTPDARRQSGAGATASIQGWTSNQIGRVDLLSSAQLRADIFAKSRFNDVQLSLDSGPQFTGRFGALRPAVSAERRWFGGAGYSRAIGVQLDWRRAFGRAEAELALARMRQDVDRNAGQDGWRSSAALSVTRSFGPVTVRGTVHLGALEARVKPESLRQFGGGLLMARRFAPLTAFAELGLVATRGRAELFLFGDRRRDRRIDLAAGAVLNRFRLGGFAPLLRVTHSSSRADIVLWDFKRTRLDVGFTRNF